MLATNRGKIRALGIARAPVAAGSSCILGLTGAWYILLFYGGAGVVLCLLHGVFRPRSMGSKASRASAEAKAGFTIEVCARFRGVLVAGGHK